MMKGDLRKKKMCIRDRSYVAAQRTMYEYNDMADAKAMLESIARSFGYICLLYTSRCV